MFSKMFSLLGNNSTHASFVENIRNRVLCSNMFSEEEEEEEEDEDEDEEQEADEEELSDVFSF